MTRNPKLWVMERALHRVGVRSEETGGFASHCTL